LEPLFTSPFEKGGLRGGYLKKISPNPFFQRGGLNNFKIKYTNEGIVF
jgi:hypothetical protein